jgi:amino acid adenylation domain-containing protein
MIYDVVEPPLGLLYLGTHLQKEFGGNVEVKIAKSRIDFDDFDSLKDLLAEFSPQVIGVRTLSFYKDFFHKTISLIRQWGVEAMIVAGGPYATSSTSTMLLDRNIDLAVLGEGEPTLNHLVKEVIQHNGAKPSYDVLRQIPGLAFIDPNHPIRNRDILLLDQATEPEVQDQRVVSAAAVNDPAYIIYTSGSTGRPKGVLVDHLALAHQISSLKERFQLDETFRYILLAAVTFDVSVMHLTLPLTTGGSVLLVDDQIKKDALRLWPLLRTHGVHMVNIVPAFMKALLKNLDKGEYGFRWLLVGGEAFDGELLDGLRETFGAQKIVNIYGPTETCINATSHLCEAEEPHAVIPIGAPLSGYRVLALDRDGNLLPKHGIGELYIGGPSLARGYLNRPELTARQFVQHPFEPDTRLYRSGDLGFVDNNGEFHFQGRVDQQVKVRGFRIEPGEIEHRLRMHPLVREAVVAMRPNGGDPSLTAYVVPSGSLNVADLGDYLKNHVPAYMVPAHFMELERIPLTSNGKLDTKNLPEPELRTDDDYVPPRDQLERSLVELWADVVGVDQSRIGIDTNFFELGGHSLKATILVSRLHRQQGVKLAVVDLFQHPTIRRLAQLVRESDRQAADTIEPVPPKEYYEASYSQNRLWVLWQLEPETTAYNMTGAVNFDEPLDPTALKQTLEALVQRHEAFRTRFREEAGDPVQVVLPSVDVDWDTVDLTGIPGEKQEGEKRRIFMEEQDTPFDLTVAPLFRIKLVLCPDNKTLIIFNLHHIIFDGWSMEILQREFFAYYRFFCGGPPFDPPPLSVQYKDYAQWQNRRLRETGAIDRALDFWRQSLEAAPLGLDLPYDQDADASPGEASAAFRMAVPDPAASELKALARNHDASLFMVMLTGFYIMLSHVSGQDDIIVAVPGFSRQDEDLMSIIGFFVNTLLIRHRLDKGGMFPEQLRQVSDTTMKVLDYQSLPLELICADLKMPYPDVQVFFNMSMDGAHSNDMIGDLESRRVERVPPSKFNL